nr:DUF1810 domain-containing protein [Lientehia hominis]
MERFVKAQELNYDAALSEIKNGHKQSHWMWYIFPQIQGLGHSEMSRYYAVKDKEEARAYMEHPVLGVRLMEISEALMQLQTNDISGVMACPDDRKLRSSMTLFSLVSNEPVFQNVLDKFFNGERDKFTLEAFDSFTNGN